MRNEHCHKVGSDYAFTPRNNDAWDGSKTTPKDEWFIVCHGTTAEGHEPPSCQMLGGRRRMSLDKLFELPLRKKAGLRREEVIGLALYTGPMYEVYNCILNEKGDHLHAFQHNHFPTTLHAIVSAIQKLGAVTPVLLDGKLYRGNGGNQCLPSRFFDFDKNNVRGMATFAFQSFTTSLEEAIRYSKPDGQQPMVFVVRPSADPLSGFADISEFSQFPKECERLLPPFSFLHPDMTQAHYEDTPSHGRVHFVPMRVTVSHSSSLDEIEERKKKIHIAEFEHRVTELRERLERIARKHNAEKRLLLRCEQKQNVGKEYNVRTLLDSIVEKVKNVLSRHRKISFKEFNKKRYASIVQESLDCVRMAPSLLKLWLLDETECVRTVMEYQLLDGHRWFINFLKKEYKNKPGSRKTIAQKLRKHMALLSDEKLYGETPLMNAAAMGLDDETLEILVSAGENVHATNSTQNDQCALHLAADSGHDQCIRALVRLGADIGQTQSNNGRNALHRACLNSHSHCVAALASLKADVNKTCSENLRTPMVEAAERGFHLCIEELARYGADLNKGDRKKMAPLWVACSYGKASCVAVLLRLGANPTLGPSEFDSPLRVASQNGHHECVQEFRRATNVNLFDAATNPLIVAISEAHSSCVHALLDLKPPKAFLLSALFAAVWLGNLDVMRALVTADIAREDLHLLQSKDEDGLTAEQFACACGADERTMALLRSGAHDNLHATLVPVQDRGHWTKLAGPRNALCISCSDTLRFYSDATAVLSYGCPSGVCAYYEITIRTPGLWPQFGLCSAEFVTRFRQQKAHLAANEGVGDTDDSWAVDGVRHKKWNGSNSPWNVSWRQGDVIGIACNMRLRQMIVSLNGDYTPPNGIVFELPQTAHVVYPALFTSAEGHLRANVGHEPFKYAFPDQEYMPFASLAQADVFVDGI